MAKIVIDGITYEVNSDNNLLQECLSQGLDLPYFCWHPCMGSVGACRQCAIKQYRNADDKNGTIVMACMTPATDGAIISIEDEQAKTMRAQVIESLMISHPHDCPVCEEGGECHLQDMTQMSGHNYRRYDKKKVTHRNQYLGPFINHEMNRCITCYRCVRYYDDYAGGTDLSAQASHHHVYFGRHEEGTLESEFSGNLVEVCPTGVFTDKGFSERYTRKWDLQVAPSVCTGCAVGCNTSPGERYGELRRIVNRYNSEVNGYFLCDRGRFGFGHVNSDDRITSPFKRNRDGSKWTENVTPTEAKAVIAALSKSPIIGIGSPRASNESNFALRRLVGEDNFYSGCSDSEHESLQLIQNLLQDSKFNAPSVKQIEAADAIIIIGEDLTNTAPRIALALRQSVRQKAFELAKANKIPSWQDAAVRELAQNELSPLTLLTPYATRLEDIASESVVGSVGVLLDLCTDIVAAIAGTAIHSDDSVAAKVASQLLAAKRPLIIAGTGACDINTIKAAANIATALHSASSTPVDLCLTVAEVNSLGANLLTKAENSLGQALKRLTQGSVTNVIILENDLYQRADTESVKLALAKASVVIAIDSLPNATTNEATLVLPATAFSEHEATYINYEGRAQLSFQVHRCHSDAQPAWRWLSSSAIAHVDDLISQCCAEVKALACLNELVPHSTLIAGMKVPRQSHRYSGRTAMKANINVHEPKQAVDDESIMAFSMEGIPAQKDSNIIASTWAPSWNSNQSISKFQEEINGELKQGHVGVAVFHRETKKSVQLPMSQAAKPAANELSVSVAWQIFGSDEMSAKAPNIKQRMVHSYVGLNLDDAKRLGIQTGDSVTLPNISQALVACVRSRQSLGTVSVYCAPEQINRYDLPAALSVTKSGDAIAGQNPLLGLLLSDCKGVGQ
jgi:NADH-quinone oxidoreductase subunit G